MGGHDGCCCVGRRTLPFSSYLSTAFLIVTFLLVRSSMAQFYLGSLGFASNGSAEATDQQRDDEKKVQG
jgi:hypothetical protein